MTTTRSIQPTETGPAPETVTLLFTDIEGSTQLLHGLEDAYPQVIGRTRQLLSKATADHGGRIADLQGDSSFVVFDDPGLALRAAVAAQQAFHAEPWPSGATVRIRIGLHTGQVTKIGDSYYGLDVHRAARIAALAGGGQVLLSSVTRAGLSEDDVPPGVGLRDLGAHRLKDIRHPEVLFDLSIEGLSDPLLGALTLPGVRPNNLPVSPTPLVGRERQIGEVRDLLLRSDTRLVTLTGPGGTGKTRLSIEVARTALDRFAHGVFLIELAPVSDPQRLASTISEVLGVPEFGSRPPAETLAHFMATRSLLLVLDNLEQIVGDDTADLVLDLLKVCPEVKMLVTSREPLNVRLERQYPVTPLELPRYGPDADLRALAANESVSLFVNRARTLVPGFDVTAENAAAICAICDRLDGLPLALELAAAQLRLFGPQALLANLGHSMEVLVGGARDLPRHQRTLRDTIAWSYRLLTPSEQQLFRSLSVFRGATIESASEIASADGPGIGVPTGLAALVSKNLVTQERAAGEPRFGMFETIRQFARQALVDAGEAAAIDQRHAEHYLALAERNAPGLTRKDQERFVRAVVTEEDNIRAALAWWIDRHDLAMTSRLLRALLWLWIPRGQFAEGKAWAEKALDVFADAEPGRDLALIWKTAGWLNVLAGGYPDALPMFERSHEILHQLSDDADQARSKVTLSVTCLVLGDPRGVDLSDQALIQARRTKDPQITALALLSAGIRHQVSGDAAQAAAAYEESLQTFHESDNVFWPGQIFHNLAQLRLESGDWQGAAALGIQALELGRRHDYPMITNLAVSVMGGVAVGMGDARRAARLFGAVDASLAELGVTFEPPDHALMLMHAERATSLLGAEEYAAAFAEGRRWREPEILAAVRQAHENPPG